MINMRTAVTALVLAVTALIPAATPDVAAQQRGGVLRIVFNPEPPTLNPGITSALPTQLVTTKVFNGLLEYDWSFNPKPALAERWSISKDGLVYTFHLRQGVTFHDGKPFTSEDVKFSFEEVLKTYHPRAGIFLRTLERVETPDPHTAVLVFKQPSPALIRLLFGADAPILPKHVYGGGDIRKNPYNVKPVGTGPFKFGEWVKGSHIVLVRNEQYWKPGLPYLDRIVVQTVPDQSSRVAVMEKVDADLSPWSTIPNFEVKRLEKLPHLRVETRGFEAYSAVQFIEINNRKPPLNNVKVRQAIAHALAREFILQNIWFGLGKLAAGPVASGMKDFFNPSVPRYEYDPKKAERLLDEAGYPRASDGVRFRVSQLFTPSGEQWVRLAEYIRAQLGKVGVAVTTEPLDYPTYLSRVFTQWEYDISAGWSLNFSDPILLERLYTTRAIRKGVPFSNSMGYSNPEVDELFTRAAVEFDPKKRADTYRRIQDMLVRDLPVVWLLEFQFTSVIKKGFEDVVTSPWGTLDSFDRVYWKPGR